MAHEIPFHLRAALNPRELPALRVERLRALHAELTSVPGLAQAALWLPPAWPHLLQLLADPHPDVRAAAAPLLGALGAALVTGREPRLAGRLPPSALLDWALALLSPSSTLPAAQRMSVESKEAALCALCACVACLPPAALQPHAQPLLQLTSSLLESSATPPRLLGPLLRLLLGVLPAVPLAALGQGFGDLVDLLCGWALEPLVASEDRRHITLVLHALRPQWHSHPDLTASLTDNMLNDVRAAVAAVASAAAASSGAADGSSDVATQAVSCMQLLQLLCDIVSAASLRSLPLPTANAAAAGTPAQPLAAPQIPLGSSVHPTPPAQAVHQGQPLHSLQPRPHMLQTPLGPHAHIGALAPGALHPQQLLPHPARPPPPPPPPPRTAQLPPQQHAILPAAAQPFMAQAPLALAAVLQTRPGVATTRHLVSLYKDILDVLSSFWRSLLRSNLLNSGFETGPAAGDGRLAAQLCRCVEMLAESVASCVVGMDPRDVREVCEGTDAGLEQRMARLALQDTTASAALKPVARSTDGSSSADWARLGSSAHAAAHNGYGVVGGALAAALPDPRDAGKAVRNDLDDNRGDAEPQQDSGAALRAFVVQAALEWAMSLLAALTMSEQGRAADALLGCCVRLLRASVSDKPRLGRGALLALVAEGDHAASLTRLRSSPQGAAVTAAAKLMQALMSDAEKTLAAEALNWLLQDLSRYLALRMQPTGAGTGVGADAAARERALAFDFAVLQAACHRGWLGRTELMRVEAATWSALCSPASGKTAALSMGAADQSSPAGALEHEPLSASVTAAAFDAWAAAALALLTMIPPTQSTDSRCSFQGLRTCCGAYLHALHGSLGGTATLLQQRVLVALRRLLAHPGVAGSGVLRQERLFRPAADLVAHGMQNADAGIRAASTECAAALAAHVLQAASVPRRPAPHRQPGDGGHDSAAKQLSAPQYASTSTLPPPLPESFSPLMSLCLDALCDASPEVAAAGGRLAAELAEAALLASARFGPAPYGTWVPAWQDEVATAPQRLALRSQQLARLLELVFQAAAAQHGGVLLRKRVPGAAAGGSSAASAAGDEGEASGRMEALQRLALSLAPVAPAEPGDDAGVSAGSGGAAVSAEDATGSVAASASERSGAALVWVALQEGAKQMVAARLRTHLGGPTQTLGALERMLQVTFSRLAQERREAGPAGVGASGRDSAWLALELTGALERAVAHAAEGHAGRDALPQPTLAFFAANKKVCEEWFARVRELLTRIAALASAHHHTMHHGLLRLRDLRNAMRQLLASLAQERKALASASTARAQQTEGRDGTGGQEGSRGAAAAPGKERAAGGGGGGGGQEAMPGRQGGKQLHRRGGQQQQQQQQAQQQPQSAAAAGDAAAPAPGAAVEQIEGNLSRLALAVVELLKLVSSALLATGEADSLQGLHAWALQAFEPLLQGVHLPGASAVAAATAAAAPLPSSSPSQAKGGAAGAAAKRRAEGTRAARSNSKQQDAFAWLQGVSQQAAGSYEQALLTYNAFLAQPQSPGGAATLADSRTSDASPVAGPTSASAAAQEMAAVAQSFVVERVAECYAALSDWSGLQGLRGAFSRTAAADQAVAGWWPSVAASVEHKFGALAVYDTAPPAARAAGDASGREAASGDPTSVLLAAMNALGQAGLAGAAASSAQQPRSHASIAPLRSTVTAELARLTDRLRASALSEPTAQREVLLHACCLRAAARGLEAAASDASSSPADSAGGPWAGLLAARGQAYASAAHGVGPALLAPDGSLRTGSFRDVGVTSTLLRAARAADPRGALPATRALSLEHIRAAAGAGNYGLATRLVQLQAATAADAAMGLHRASGAPEAPAGGVVVGAGTVLSVAHTLLSAAAARLPASQVVDLQLRVLLPHVLSGQQRNGYGLQLQGPDAEDLTYALCTLARWMMKAGAAQPPRQAAEAAQRQQRSPSAGQAQSQSRAAGAVQAQASVAPAPWTAAADWQSLTRQWIGELSFAHSATPAPSAAPGAAPAPFAVAEPLLHGYHPAAACCLRALQLSHGSARAWKAWADLLHRATREYRTRAARVPPPGAVATDGSPAAQPESTSNVAGAAKLWTAGYGAAAAAYCRYLALAHGHDAGRPEEALQVLLQLLQIIMRHATSLEQLLAEHLAMVPPVAWAVIAPQLLAQLPGASGAARRLLAAALAAVGRAAPSLVLYPAVVEVRAADAAAAAAAAADGAERAVSPPPGAAVPELRALLHELGRARPGLLAGVGLLVGEMERLTVLVDERWAALLAEAEVEVARRAVSLQAETARVAEDASLSPEQRQALLASRYSTLMAPAVLLLERELRATVAQPPETPHERRFTESVLPRLRAAIAALRDGTGVRDWAKPQAAWAPLRAAAAALARRQRQPLPPMPDLSPVLSALADSEVPMPGCHDGAADAAAAAATAGAGAVTVAGVEPEVVAMSTKTRPKRVALRGSDGVAYVYLLKGREDLRMDERLMQVLRAIKAMLQADPAASSRDLASIRHYSVTPLGPRAGLIQWVPSTTSLFAVVRSWQTATLERHAAMAAARQEGAARAAAEGAPPPPELEPPPAAALHRPMDLFYATLVPALQERGLSSATPRREWPADVLRAVLAKLAAAAPRGLLARVLWAGGGSAASSWRRQQRYGRSLGVMSCVGHLLGLGDRHPDNILLEGREAGVVHIDYNVCWDKGAKLRVPEVVPFRLTQMLVHALGVGGLEGPFRAACEAALSCLRRRREALVPLVEAVLGDPGVDWAVEREDVAARQDMELAVALNLFVSRVEEVQRQLEVAEESLPGLVDGPAAALLSYVEAHAFAEALKSAAAEAASRAQQAKAALEAASRAEAEARAIVGAAAQEAASLAAEGAALSAAVPQLLQQCGAWAQQHARTLGVLREGSFLEGTLGTAASWHAAESGAALGLLAPVAGPGPVPLTAAAPLALLPAVLGGDGSVLAQLPEALVLACHECDRQAAELLSRREAALAAATSALTQYGVIVRKLLPPSYPAASYHHRWAQTLAALAAGGLTLPALAQAQTLAPREPRPADVAAEWQALRGSHRLATAAAMALAPDSSETAAAAAGPAGAARVPGRELVGAVAAATAAVAEAHGAAERQLRAAAAAIGRGSGGPGDAAPDALAQALTQSLRRWQEQTANIGDEVTAVANDVSGSDHGGAVAAAAAVSLRQLALSAQEQLRALVSTSTPDTAHLERFARLRGDFAGLAAIATAVADAGLGEALLGAPAQPPGFRRGGGGSSASLSRQAGTPGLPVPLPWLGAAAAALGRFGEVVQRLAVDVVPEVAGQLHMGNGGGLLAQATSDLHALLAPVEEALRAGRDCHNRLAALAELTATYHTRAAHLTSQLARSDGDAQLGSGERASLEAELQALDAAWMSREAMAANLTAAAARATDGLAEALRRLYATVLGLARLPLELQPSDGASAAAMAAAMGGEGWAETGVGGHAAASALAAFWEASSAALEDQHLQSGTLPEHGPAGRGPHGGAAVARHEVPTGMRQLWRCVEVVRLVSRSLSACQAARLAAPPGTDRALSEAYGAVLPLLAAMATEHTLAHLAPQLEVQLSALAAHLETAAQAPLRAGTLSGDGGIDGQGAGRTGAAAAAADTALHTTELVPFTDFDPRVAGEGEALGGLEDLDDAEEGGVPEWDAYEDGDALGNVDDEAPDGEAGEYDLDLGLELDLDDGFGGDDEDEIGGSEAALGEESAATEPVGIIVTPDQVGELVVRLAAAAAAAAVAANAAQLNPATAATAAAAAAPSLRSAAAAGHSWAAGPEARALRAGRLQRLASYEWLHEHHLLQALPAGDPRVGQGLAQFFASQPPDPLQPSARVTSPSRLALLSALQGALDELPGLEAALADWEAAGGGAVGQVVALLRGSPEQFPVDTALAAQRAGGLVARRQQWVAESHGVAVRVCQVAEALLQFEYSRQGITWASGGAAAADGFAAHCQLLGRAEVLATLAAGGSEAARAAAVAEASSRAAEAGRQAAEARHTLEAAQYEESAASSQLAAHLPLLVSRAMDLPAAMAELEQPARALAQLLDGKLGPALKELSSVSAQHSAAADVASVAASVASHFERCRQAVAALTEAAPAIAAALAAADATAPLPPEMATEVGFLSAQLVGGAAAAAAMRERAMALLQNLAAPASALQPVVHVVAELPRGATQLRSELGTLASAAGSIAAAVQSKHVLPAVVEQQRQQGRQLQLEQASGGPASQLPQGTSTAVSQTAQGTSAEVADSSGATPAMLPPTGDTSAAGKPAADTTEALATESGVPAPLGLTPEGVDVLAPQSAQATGAAASRGPASCGAPPLSPPQTGAAASTAGHTAAVPAGAVIPGHVQHHRSRRSAADEARRRAFATGALRRFVAKLEGREGEGASRSGAQGPSDHSGSAATAASPAPALSVTEQVDLLIRQATSVDRLSQMYEGWAAWL